MIKKIMFRETCWFPASNQPINQLKLLLILSSEFKFDQEPVFTNVAQLNLTETLVTYSRDGNFDQPGVFSSAS